jgi:predicted ester cyclase
MEVREVINSYYNCVNNSKWDDWLKLFSDDVTGDEQLAGHFAGIDVLKGAVGAITQGYKKFQMFPQRVLVDGDAAAVIWRCDATNRNGVPIAYRDKDKKLTARQVIGANYFQIQNGRIVYMRTVHDSEPFRPFTNPEEF